LLIKHDVANVNRHDCAASLRAINSYQSWWHVSFTRTM